MSTTKEKRNSIIKDLKNLLIWISIALIIRWQVIEPRWIPSGSMLPTLQIQDKILVEKVTPKITSKSNLSKLKNKIVVFNVPDQLIDAGYEADTALIKRVIGIPGDKVEVRDGNLYLNDIAQDNFFFDKNIKFLAWPIMYLATICTMVVISYWVYYIYIYGLSAAKGPISIIPVALWCYAVAVGPIQYMASKEPPESIGTNLITIFTTIGGIWLFIAMVIFKINFFIPVRLLNGTFRNAVFFNYIGALLIIN